MGEENICDDGDTSLNNKLFEEYKDYMKSVLQIFLGSFMKQAAEKELDVRSFIDNFVQTNFSNDKISRLHSDT